MRLFFVCFIVLLTNCEIFVVGQQIAEQKCREFAEAVYVEENDILGRNFKSKVSTCELVAEPLIVGGKAAKAKEFPHMALLGFGKSPTSALYWLCGGSLISEKHILTAAHCQNPTYGPAQLVKLGAIRQDDFESHVQQKRVRHCIVFPDYIKTISYHDLAVCELKEAVEFSAYIRPACLNTKHDLAITALQAIGFGKTDYYDKEMNQKLLKVRLDIIERSTCASYTNSPSQLPQNITNGQLCAGSLKYGERDTCQGDSGGPLQMVLENPYCMYSIVGITSFGRICGMEYSPGIYTNVSHYVKWIERIVWQ